MNTITPIRMNPNLQDRQKQVTNKQSSNPAFKGAIGNKVVEQLVNKKEVTVAGVLALTAGVVGLNKDKVADVVESLVDKVNKLLYERDLLKIEKENLNDKLIDSQNARENTRVEGNKFLDYANGIIENQKKDIEQKDAKIAKLQKYEAMAKVKSVEEIGLVMPDEAIATLKEAGAKNKEAHASLMNYLLTGKGQEEFLAQMERNATLYKANREGILNIPEVNAELRKKQYSFLPAVGNDSYSVACKMLYNCLTVQPKAGYIKSPAIREQIKTNAEALINPMKQERVNYGTSVKTEIESSLKFHEGLEDAMKGAEEQGLEYVSETNDGVSATQSYRTFKKDGNLYDYSLKDLVRGYKGCARVKTPDGEILYDNSNI